MTILLVKKKTLHTYYYDKYNTAVRLRASSKLIFLSTFSRLRVILRSRVLLGVRAHVLEKDMSP